jgi:DNA (cytosine-5)-methyltransferase 1
MLGADDPRDGWPATLATIRAVRPRWVIVENVGGSPIEAWAADLGPSMFRPGLYPHVSTRFLDAVDWGLPSHRRREFLVAGPVPYRWPEPTHCGPDAPVAARMRLRPWVGFGEALGLVDVVARQDRGAGMTERHGDRPAIPGDMPLNGVRSGGQGGYVLLPGNGGHLPAPRCASEPAHTVTGSCPQYLSLPSAGVCTTEVKGTRASAASNFTFNGGPDCASDSLFLATGRRRLTWQECATLVGFPDDYPFQGTIEARYRQVGNAVAPIMAEALARSIPREAP